MLVFDLIGYFGIAICFISYFFTIRGDISPTGLLYPLLGVLVSVCLGVSIIAHGQLYTPAFFIQGMFGLISLYGLYLNRRI